MSRSSFLIAAMTVGALAMGQAHAQPPMGPHGCGPGGLPFLEGVNLTAKQKDSVKKIFKEGHEDMKALHRQEHDLHDRFEALMLTPGKIDQAKLDALTTEQNALDAKENAARQATAVKVHDVLTAEQVSAAKDRHDKIHALMDQVHSIEHADSKDDE
ncbi:Spy/CpxP family protein refolding chaperone [Acetobacter sp.]|uniref:Spy/CpxP family protein refolding chaperone n=1 Tax=Acetobacter sp. TaxID=440 RepID=UPI0025BC6223|nr:Spy/CpxP family protein refolding chaperone [Acetobacter sp.]MCH4092463.1 Spy/CpxP family protein refolding chaperone [Acetobacter sp.]MCI1299597.1 Spy/CpxP family protein refolding chaperone [Acetobacter sp.]MCI1315523.1 Spy/CpxP family protein refolding chaperone [Acetobacter sp.]